MSGRRAGIITMVGSAIQRTASASLARF